MEEILNRARELLAQFAKYPWFECLVKTAPLVDIKIDDPEFRNEVIKKTMDDHINTYLSYSYDQVEAETEMFRNLADIDIALFIRLFR